MDPKKRPTFVQLCTHYTHDILFFDCVPKTLKNRIIWSIRQKFSFPSTTWSLSLRRLQAWENESPHFNCTVSGVQPFVHGNDTHHVTSANRASLEVSCCVPAVLQMCRVVPCVNAVSCGSLCSFSSCHRMTGSAVCFRTKYFKGDASSKFHWCLRLYSTGLFVNLVKAHISVIISMKFEFTKGCILNQVSH